MNSLITRVKNDLNYRIKLFLSISIIFNIVYSVYLFIVSRIYSSRWFLVMAIYFFLLTISRVFCFIHVNPKKREIDKAKTMRLSGFFMLTINLVVSVMTFILTIKKQMITHHEITVIALATYTFSSLTIAIVNSVRFIKKRESVYSSIKFISLVSSSVSMITLTNVMLSTFGKNNEQLRNVILPILCIVVSIFILLVAIYMIRTANQKLRILRNEEERK